MNTTTSRHGLRRSILAPATLLPPLALLIALAIPALGSGASHAATARAVMERITIHASAVRLPAQVPTGWLALTLVNDTRAPASAGLGRANPGATPKAIDAANAASDTPQGFLQLVHLLTFLGGPDSVPPGGKETAILDLRTPGHYGLQLDSGNGPGHATLFTVTAGSGQSAALPAHALPVALKEMKFVGLPSTLAAGPITFKLTNTGEQVHEITLARLDPGKSLADVKNLFKGPQQGPGGPPPWAHVVGGLNMLSARQTAYLMVNLTPGNYVAVCTMPDTAPGAMQGVPHAAEGMLTGFSVR